jgi:hypothetical protein
VRRVLAILLAGLALGVPTVALALQQGSSSADELWRRYPLDAQGSTSTPEQPTTTTAPPRTAAASGAPRRVATASASGGQDGSSSGALPILLAMAALAAAAAAALVLRGGQRRPAPAKGLAPPTGAAAPKPPLVRSEAGAISLWAEPPEEAHMPEPPIPALSDHEAALPPDRDVAWTTEITWEQSRDRARFNALAVAPGGREAVTVASSIWLDWPPRERSAVDALGDAVRSLESELADAGWSALEPGQPWYAKRFVWMPAGDRAAAEALAPVIDLPVAAEEVEREPFATPPDAAPSRASAPARPTEYPDLPRDTVPYRDGLAGGALRSPRGRHEPVPAISAVDGSDGPGPTTDGPPAGAPVRRCAIRFARLSGKGRFFVVTVLADGTKRVVAYSQEFPASRDGSVPHEGPSRNAFDELLERLQAAGWVRVETGGAWYQVELVKAGDVEYEQAIVSCWRGMRSAQFLALLVDDFGKGSTYAQSPVFQLRASESLEPRGSAQDARHALLSALRDDGWQVTGTAGEWYATTLRRRLKHGPALTPGAAVGRGPRTDPERLTDRQAAKRSNIQQTDKAL